MTRRQFVSLIAGAFLLSSPAIAAEREWQNATWHDYKVERPRVLFSAEPRDPTSNLPRTTAAKEVRTYIIDTSTQRLELRQDATVDTPRIDVLIGEPVLIAIEKKTVYVKDADGKEHKLSLRKQSPLEPQPKRRE
jgi:hypothetical protein